MDLFNHLIFSYEVCSVWGPNSFIVCRSKTAFLLQFPFVLCNLFLSVSFHITLILFYSLPCYRKYSAIVVAFHEYFYTYII